MQNNLTPRDWIRLALLTVLITFAFQSAVFVGQYAAARMNLHMALDKVSARISLDAGFLDVGNTSLNTPVDDRAVSQYLNRFNHKLTQMRYPARLLTLQTVPYQSDLPDDFTERELLTFTTAEQEITAEIATLSAFHYLRFNILSLLLALIAVPFIFTNRRKRRRRQLDENLNAVPVAKLIINLQEKTLSNGVDDKQVILQNKPLCFYTALAKYCTQTPEPLLFHNQDVPAELITLANQVFSRLIALGHTKRKRPDFNANLDKTLSEIRAALDDVFSDFPKEKELYYPPRAQGEGSRSKQHSFALTHIQEDDIEIIGE